VRRAEHWILRCVPTISASAAQSEPPKIKQPNSMQRIDRNTSKIIEILQKFDKRMSKTLLNIRIKMQHPPTVTPNDFQVKPSYSRPSAVSPRFYLGRFRPPVEQVGASQHAKFARGFEPRTTFSSRQVATPLPNFCENSEGHWNRTTP
jgi:hypothetical protein